MPEPEFQDFDPTFNMQQMAEWMMAAADYGDKVLRDHPEKKEICTQLRTGALGVVECHGKIVGSLLALAPFVHLIDEAKIRFDAGITTYRRFAPCSFNGFVSFTSKRSPPTGR